MNGGNRWDDREERRRARREWRRQRESGCGSLAHAVRGPITLITLGVLFALHNFTPYTFGQTWPVLLIVFGLLSLLGRGARPAPPPGGYPASAPPYQSPAPPPGGYRQSQYAQPAAPGAAGKPGTGDADPSSSSGGAQ